MCREANQYLSYEYRKGWKLPSSLGSSSINNRLAAIRKLAVEAADNSLLPPEVAAGGKRPADQTPRP